MSQRAVRNEIVDKAREAYAKIKATSTPEEKMRIALEAIHELHEYAEGLCTFQEDWEELYEAVEWIDVYEDLIDVTEQLAAKGLGA